MTLTNAEELRLEEASPRAPGRGRRVGVIVLGVVLAGVACTLVGLTFVQGSWWYSYGTDQALDRESRARVAAIRDAVDASGAMPRVVVWLDEALDPNADPSTVRVYLLSAQQALKAADDPELVQAVEELRAIIQTLQGAPIKGTSTPRPISTLEWPW